MSTIAAVCVVKNEEDDLAEWLAFHFEIGIKKILIYDNVSTDKSREIAISFSEKYDVQLIKWDMTSSDYQRQAYMHAVTRIGSQADWIAFIDADEFIVSNAPCDTLGFLDEFGMDVSQVCLNWATFGSSGHVERPEGLVIESFLKRASADSGINRHVKAIVRPTHVRGCLIPHAFDVTGRTIDALGTDIRWSEANGVGLIHGAPIYKIAWINHYWTKSKNQWLKKISRGYHDIPDDNRGLNDLMAFDLECIEQDENAVSMAGRVRAVLQATLKPKPDQRLRRQIWRNADPFGTVGIANNTLDLQGWGSTHNFLSESIEQIRPSVIVEIGVWKGGSTIFMAEKVRNLGLNCSVVSVDTWLGAWDHWASDKWFGELGFAEGSSTLFKKFLTNVKILDLQDYVIPLPLDSTNAFVFMKSLGVNADIIHIDAGHDYAAVKNDLTLWWDILRPGGILIGDDYDIGGGWPEVRQAFDEFVGQYKIKDFEYYGNKCRFRKA